VRASESKSLQLESEILHEVWFTPSTRQLATDVLLEAFVTHHLIESNSLDALITHLIDSDSAPTQTRFRQRDNMPG